jgi:hypothetical protein
MTNSQIEAQARRVLAELWKHREHLGHAPGADPMSMLDPGLAAEALGISYEYHEELGRFGDKGDRFETAGFINRARRLIAVSRRFSLEVQRFTGAHELGHYILHQEAVQHRDRPTFGVEHARPRMEREADYFAACFLAPRKLLIESFTQRFGRQPLHLTDDVRWELKHDDFDPIDSGDGVRDFAVAAAAARSFRRIRFRSLAEQFRISVSAMAIRLMELGLLEG